MPEPQFATIDEDLPRTFRREREAREREAREREEREREATIIEPAFLRRETSHHARRLIAEPPEDGLLQIGFLRLMAFFIKAVFAAIPAVLILAVLLWLGGQALATFFPQLPRMQIFIHFPK